MVWGVETRQWAVSGTTAGDVQTASLLQEVFRETVEGPGPRPVPIRPSFPHPTPHPFDRGTSHENGDVPGARLRYYASRYLSPFTQKKVLTVDRGSTYGRDLAE